MPIGLSTYSFTWRSRSDDGRGISVMEMIENTRALGASVLQICDYEPIERIDVVEQVDIRQAAEDNGIALELGTRGVDAAALDRYLALATGLGVGMVRTMYARFGESLSLESFERQLQVAATKYQAAGVQLCIETYEMITTRDLVDTLHRISNPSLGICLDPANSLAALETPRQVIQTAAHLVTNVHIKDFGFDRRTGGMGFEITGRRLGDGQLDYPSMLEAIDWDVRNLSLVLEHWLPWQGSLTQTRAMESEWTSHGVRTLLDYTAQKEANRLSA